MRVTEAFGRWREWSPTKTTESTPQDRDDCGAELRALRRSQRPQESGVQIAVKPQTEIHRPSGA